MSNKEAPNNTTASNSSTNITEVTPKNKKNKKKKGLRDKSNESPSQTNGVQQQLQNRPKAKQQETGSSNAIEPAEETLEDILHHDTESSPKEDDETHRQVPDEVPLATRIEANGPLSESKQYDLKHSSQAHNVPDEPQEVTLETLTREREELRNEVSQIRRTLEGLQEKHEDQIVKMRGQVAEAQKEKDSSDSQYRSLLDKVNTIRTQLGDRLKADAEDLLQAKARIEELEDRNAAYKEEADARGSEVLSLVEQKEQQAKELSTLRNRTTLSQQNFSKEREELLAREVHAKEEFEAARQAMQDWEILAMEERSIRESLTEKVSDLEEQVQSSREISERASAEADQQRSTIESLQRALQELQDTRRQELRETVESSQIHIHDLQNRVAENEEKAKAATSALDSTKQELARVMPFELEVREKNLLIGKLRHEAVILNDHLTKALRALKKGKPKDNIDKALVTNHILHFLALDRADPKKFQVLQIIASLLNWDEEQREQAGLMRPGASNPNQKYSFPSWHRTPSTATLNSDFTLDNGRKESLSQLWSEFLETEAQEQVSNSHSPSSPVVAGTPTGQKPT